MASEDHVLSEDNNVRRQNNQQSGDDVDVPNETKVGTKLKDEIQKNIISMILLILISIPLLNGDTWYDNVTSYEKGLDELVYFKSKGSAMFDVSVGIFISEMTQKTFPLIYFQIPVNGTCCEFPKQFPNYISSVRSTNDLRSE